MVTWGDRKEHENKLFDVLKKLETAKYRASERKCKFFFIKTRLLRHEIDETGINPNKEKVKAILDSKLPENQKHLESVLVQYNSLLNSHRDYRKKRKDSGDSRKRTRYRTGGNNKTSISTTEEMLTEEPCLAHYAKDRENIVTTDVSKTGLGIPLWPKQSDGEINR